MSVAIGYMPGAFGPGEQDPHFLRQLVQVGDTYGYDSLWLSDRIVGRQLSLEPLVALAMVAAYSDRLKFGWCPSIAWMNMNKRSVRTLAVHS
jgi:alkanesulfonate monooxygenase SsuD/methylene tetrahydromethanopterin reductase-like flavin-dependent oxidoreductase (luciferase family)